ncbi:MAG: hypothetical protein WEC79_06380, partial [Thermomicrobiales bacterium]
MADQVALAHMNYNSLPAVTFSESTAPDDLYLATPDRLAYALGWIVANQIVRARFADTAVDVLPVFHPEHGWDRFLITRRASSHLFNGVPADELGRIMLTGDDAPRYVRPAERVRVGLGQLLSSDPDAAINRVLTKITNRPEGVGNLKRVRPSEHAPRYPELYEAVTELVLENPGLVPSREVYIDNEQIDGQFHPLYLHATELSSHGSADRHGANLPVITYNWFQLQYQEMFAFLDRRGSRAIYRTDRSTWARPRVQLSDEPTERLKGRIAGWLRLGGATPDRD